MHQSIDWTKNPIQLRVVTHVSRVLFIPIGWECHACLMSINYWHSCCIRFACHSLYWFHLSPGFYFSKFNPFPLCIFQWFHSIFTNLRVLFLVPTTNSLQCAMGIISYSHSQGSPLSSCVLSRVLSPNLITNKITILLLGRTSWSILKLYAFTWKLKFWNFSIFLILNVFIVYCIHSATYPLILSEYAMNFTFVGFRHPFCSSVSLPWFGCLCP